MGVKIGSGSFISVLINYCLCADSQMYTDTVMIREKNSLESIITFLVFGHYIFFSYGGILMFKREFSYLKYWENHWWRSLFLVLMNLLLLIFLQTNCWLLYLWFYGSWNYLMSSHKLSSEYRKINLLEKIGKKFWWLS